VRLLRRFIPRNGVRIAASSYSSPRNVTRITARHLPPATHHAALVAGDYARNSGCLKLPRNDKEWVIARNVVTKQSSRFIQLLSLLLFLIKAERIVVN